jgi:hypothetical protein
MKSRSLCPWSIVSSKFASRTPCGESQQDFEIFSSKSTISQTLVSFEGTVRLDRRVESVQFGGVALYTATSEENRKRPEVIGRKGSVV